MGVQRTTAILLVVGCLVVAASATRRLGDSNHGGAVLQAGAEPSTSCTQFTACGTCVAAQGSGKIRSGYQCIWDVNTGSCHSDKSERQDGWARNVAGCTAAIKTGVKAMQATYAAFACMDAARFAQCINPKVKEAVLAREAEAKEQQAPDKFRGHFPPHVATRAFIQNKKTESMSLKLEAAKNGNDWSDIPADLDATARALEGVKAGVCTSFAYIMYSKIKATYPKLITRLEIVDNGETSLGTHLFLLVNREGAAVAVGDVVPPISTWGAGFIADAWEASLGYDLVSTELGPNHGKKKGQRVVFAQTF